MRFNPFDLFKTVWMGFVLIGFIVGCMIRDWGELYFMDKSLGTDRSFSPFSSEEIA